MAARMPEWVPMARKKRTTRTGRSATTGRLGRRTSPVRVFDMARSWGMNDGTIDDLVGRDHCVRKGRRCRVGGDVAVFFDRFASPSLLSEAHEEEVIATTNHCARGF